MVDAAVAATSASPPTIHKLEKPQAWKEAVAGASSGAVSRSLLAPVERVKLLKQLQGSVVNVEARVTKSAWKVALCIYQTEGVLAFWRGNAPNVLRVSGTAAINFTCMDYYKRAAEPWTTKNNNSGDVTDVRKRKRVASFVSGGLAGATATTVLYPVEFLRTRLAMDLGGANAARQRQYTGMLDVLRTIYRTDGVLGMYQGYGIALVGGVVYRIILLGGYDALKSELVFRKENRMQQPEFENDTTNRVAATELSWVERIASAQAISLMAGTTAYPFDSVRRRMMMQAGKKRVDRLYRNSMHCIRTVHTKEGIRGFYLGLGPNIVRSVSGALLLVGYDSIRKLLQ